MEEKRPLGPMASRVLKVLIATLRMNPDSETIQREAAVLCSDFAFATDAAAAAKDGVKLAVRGIIEAGGLKALTAAYNGVPLTDEMQVRMTGDGGGCSRLLHAVGFSLCGQL